MTVATEVQSASSFITVVDGVLDDAHFQAVGSASCAAANCHGGRRPGLTVLTLPRGFEFQVWKEQDPHARAAWTLANDRSQKMLEQLGITSAGKIVDQAGYDNCLACHNPSGRHAARDTSEGVGCEACHGPAGEWIAKHYRWDWHPASAARLGKLATTDLGVRARVCVDCHVGSHRREVSHDLIAAGHPALRFEMNAYQNRLPKHWRSDGAQADPAHQLRTWLAGQVAQVDASLDLLATRADQPEKPWPEFAEYNCAICHQQLRAGRANSRTTTPAARLPHWGDWNFSFARDTSLLSSTVAATLADIDRRMISLPTGERRIEVARLAHQAKSQLLGVGMGPGLAAQDRARTIEAVRQLLDAKGELTWEAAANSYLALDVLTRQASGSDPVGDDLSQLRQLHTDLVENGVANRWQLGVNPSERQQVRAIIERLLSNVR